MGWILRNGLRANAYVSSEQLRHGDGAQGGSVPPRGGTAGVGLVGGQEELGMEVALPADCLQGVPTVDPKSKFKS